MCSSARSSRACARRWKTPWSDTANLLAEIVADDVKAGTVGQSALFSRIEAIARRRLDVRIDGFTKNELSYRVYITDARGIVLFDSRRPRPGQGLLALERRLPDPARQVRRPQHPPCPDDEASTVMHVAAPISDGDSIIGVLTVAKPNSTVQKFIERGQQAMLRAARCCWRCRC
jgi:two-component system sensor histidine kinase CreC